MCQNSVYDDIADKIIPCSGYMPHLLQTADQTHTSEQKQLCDLERSCDQQMERVARTEVLVSSIPDVLSAIASSTMRESRQFGEKQPACPSIERVREAKARDENMLRHNVD